mgnify:CR=1 FL=1
MRRASFRWKPRGEAKKRYKVKVGEYSTGRAKYGYKCVACEEVFKSGEVKMDHVEPVVPLTGWESLDNFAIRMFCEEDNFQCLCPACHDIKTQREKDYRVAFRKLEQDTDEYIALEKEANEFILAYIEENNKYIQEHKDIK